MKKTIIIASTICTLLLAACEKTTFINQNNSYHAPVNGTLTVDSTALTLNGMITSIDSFAITTNLNWNIAVTPTGTTWLGIKSYATSTGNKVIVSALSSNNADTARTATITITAYGDTAIKPVTIVVTQLPYTINNPNAQNCDSTPYRIGTTLVFSLAQGGNSKETFTTDTVINGITYYGTKISTGNGRQYVYYAVDSAGNNWEMLPQIGDYPASNMIYCKQNQAVGNSWSDTFPSISQPSTVSYVYTHQVLQTGLNFSIGGITYTNGTQVQESLYAINNGVSSLVSTTTRTFQCGLGVVQTIEYGTVYSTLAGYTY